MKDRMQVALEKAQVEIEKTRDAVANAPSRQMYHFMPQQGWLNDPNGLIYFRGHYHFFYQYNPYDSFWGAMHWGHAVSDDMLHFEYLPVALAPSEPYDDHPKGGCFSGSAIEHDGKLYLLYTGSANHGHGFVQSQCVAYSDDGIHFTKYEHNPVVRAPEGYDVTNFRDPKVWKHNDTYYMVCGTSKNGFAQALLFQSANLLQWRFVSVLAESRGELGTMWECPDFFAIGDRYVLVVSPMGVGERKTIYLVGDMDYRTGKFDYHKIGEVDWGCDYYAPQTFVDHQHRRIMVAWANAWEWMPWWKDWGPTYQEHWCGSFTIPREVTLTSDDTLSCKPIVEVEHLRFGKSSFTNLLISDSYQIPTADSCAFDLNMILDLSQTTAKRIILSLRGDSSHETRLILDLEQSTMCLDRSRADNWSNGVSRSLLPLTQYKQLSIRVLVDTCSVEVFALDGTVNHSCNIYPTVEQNTNRIQVEGGVAFISSMESFGLKRCIK